MLTPAQAATGSLVSVVGLAGDLTSATLRDLTPTLAEGTIAFSNDQFHVMGMDGDGGNLRDLATGTSAVASLDFNSTGSRIYFADDAIKYVASTGGTITPVSPSAARRAALAPNGSTLAFCPFERGLTTIKTMSTSGTNIFTVTTIGADNFGLDWIDNDWIVYSCGLQLGMVKKDGSGDQFITSGSSGFSWTFPRVSPDKRSLAAITFGTGRYGVEVFNLSPSGVDYPGSYYPITGVVRAVTWTPDSRELIALYENGTIGTLGLNGAPQTLYRQLKVAAGFSCIDVAPPPAERLLVGTGGLFNSTAAGMLVSQSGSRLYGALAWDATTRSTSAISFEADASNDTTIIYRIEADAITKLAYTQNNSFKFVPALGSIAVNGAIVCFDGATGALASVVTYKETRGGAKPSISGSGATATVVGSDLTKFDAHTGTTTLGLSRVELR
ncbi:MAG: hypothetical protein ACAH95_15075 [Fimbriimonas sp.]